MRLGFTEGGRSPTGGKSKRPRRSSGVDAIQLLLEQFLRSLVAKDLSWQAVNSVGKESNVLYAVLRNALSLWNKPPEHSVMALIVEAYQNGEPVNDSPEKRI